MVRHCPGCGVNTWYGSCAQDCPLEAPRTPDLLDNQGEVLPPSYGADADVKPEWGDLGTEIVPGTVSTLAGLVPLMPVKVIAFWAFHLWPSARTRVSEFVTVYTGQPVARPPAPPSGGSNHLREHRLSWWHTEYLETRAGYDPRFERRVRVVFDENVVMRLYAELAHLADCGTMPSRRLVRTLYWTMSVVKRHMDAVTGTRSSTDDYRALDAAYFGPGPKDDGFAVVEVPDLNKLACRLMNSAPAILAHLHTMRTDGIANADAYCVRLARQAAAKEAKRKAAWDEVAREKAAEVAREEEAARVEGLRKLKIPAANVRPTDSAVVAQCVGAVAGGDVNASMVDDCRDIAVRNHRAWTAATNAFAELRVKLNGLQAQRPLTREARRATKTAIAAVRSQMVAVKTHRDQFKHVRTRARSVAVTAGAQPAKGPGKKRACR